MPTVGEKIRYYRLKRKLSLRKLGEIAHISHSFISDIEHGRSNPSLDTLKALAKALKVSVSSLYDDDGTLPVDKEEADSPIGLSSQGNINIKELEKIINRAVRKALKEREKRDGDDT